MQDQMEPGKNWKAFELRTNEKEVQEKWENTKIYSTIKPDVSQEKFFCTFPIPYMNGRLHLGHAFTMSKYDFACRFKKMMGVNVLEPFSFHLTGMPIVAAADKLKEILITIDNSANKLQTINNLSEDS